MGIADPFAAQDKDKDIQLVHHAPGSRVPFSVTDGTRLLMQELRVAVPAHVWAMRSFASHSGGRVSWDRHVQDSSHFARLPLSRLFTFAHGHCVETPHQTQLAQIQHSFPSLSPRLVAGLLAGWFPSCLFSEGIEGPGDPDSEADCDREEGEPDRGQGDPDEELNEVTVFGLSLERLGDEQF
jgi:hypothetical protein